MKNKLPKNVEKFVTRNFSLVDIRAIDEEKNNTIEGHAAVYNQKANIYGWFYEVIERGAFDSTDFDDVLFFVNHDTRKIPLARSRRNDANSTMQLKVDEKGLFIKANLDVQNNGEARSLYSSVGRGDIDGMSFMFKIKEEYWTDLDSDMPTRHITNVKKVYEVSAVNMPFYSDTDISTRDQGALDNAKIELDNARSQKLDNPSALEVERYKTDILLKG